MRKRFGTLSLVLAVVFFIAERILHGRGGERLAGRMAGWRLIAARLALRRFGYFTPTGIALRLGVRVLRRYFL